MPELSVVCEPPTPPPPSTNKQRRETCAFGHGQARELQHKSPEWHTLVRRMNALMGLSQQENKARFPGSLPVSLMRADIPDLFFKGKDYAVNYKSHGKRYMWMLDRLHDYPVAAIIDRSLRILLVPTPPLPAQAFDGTLFDGELVTIVQDKDGADAHTSAPSSPKQKRQKRSSSPPSVLPTHVFEIMDVIAVNGRNACRTWYYTHRMDLGVRFLAVCRASAGHAAHASALPAPDTSEFPVSSAVAERYARCQARKIGGGSAMWEVRGGCFHVSAKPVFAMQDVQHVVEKVFPLLPFEEDGLVPTPIAEPVRPMHCPDMKKWKFGNNHTCDFMVLSAAKAQQMRWCIPPDNAATLFQDLVEGADAPTIKEHYHYCWLAVCDKSPRDLVLFTRCAIDLGSFPFLAEIEGRVAEFRWHAQLQKWAPEVTKDNPTSLRADRAYPNALNTVSKTCINLLENIDYRELCCSAESTVFHADYDSPFARTVPEVGATITTTIANSSR